MIPYNQRSLKMMNDCTWPYPILGPVGWMDGYVKEKNEIAQRYALEIKVLSITRKKASRPGFEPGLKACCAKNSAGLRDVHYPIGTKHPSWLLRVI